MKPMLINEANKSSINVFKATLYIYKMDPISLH